MTASTSIKGTPTTTDGANCLFTMSRVFLQRFSQQCLARRAHPSYLVRRCNSSSAAPVFDWQDPLASKTLLTEEELAISETAERYCQEQLLPRVLRKCLTVP